MEKRQTLIGIKWLPLGANDKPTAALVAPVSAGVRG